MPPEKERKLVMSLSSTFKGTSLLLAQTLTYGFLFLKSSLFALQSEGFTEPSGNASRSLAAFFPEGWVIGNQLHVIN